MQSTKLIGIRLPKKKLDRNTLNVDKPTIGERYMSLCLRKGEKKSGRTTSPAIVPQPPATGLRMRMYAENIHASVYLRPQCLPLALWLSLSRALELSHSLTHSLTHFRVSSQEKGTPKMVGTGLRKCVYTNPHKHTTTSTGSRASDRNAHTHLRSPLTHSLFCFSRRRCLN
jgi:hypothetical protein